MVEDWWVGLTRTEDEGWDERRVTFDREDTMTDQK